MMKSLQSHEAIDVCIGKYAKEHAKALHLSLSLIHKWQEPSTDFEDSGAFNPLDRLETMIHTSVELGASPAEAMAPLYYLADRFGHIAYPLHAGPATARDVSSELLETIARFGDLVRDTAEIMQDNVIKPGEYRRLKKEGQDLIRQISVFLDAAGKAVLGPAGRRAESRQP